MSGFLLVSYNRGSPQFVRGFEVEHGDVRVLALVELVEIVGRRATDLGGEDIVVDAELVEVSELNHIGGR